MSLVAAQGRRAVVVLALVTLGLDGCGPSYSPDIYASNAAQQANKVQSGVIVGVRPVRISSQGAVGGVAGATAGGVAGSQIGVGPTSAFAAIGGSVLGGLAGAATEHLTSDTDGFEYVVHEANGDMVSVTQKDEKPLGVGQKVLVIAGPQARIVADYTVPFEPPAKTKAIVQTPLPAPAAATDATSAHPPAAATDATSAHPPAAATDASSAHPPAAATDASSAHPAPPPTSPPTPSLPAGTDVPPQLPAVFGAPPVTPPAVILPPETASAPPVAPSPPTP